MKQNEYSHDQKTSITNKPSISVESQAQFTIMLVIILGKRLFHLSLLNGLKVCYKVIINKLLLV